ncbi:MAG: bifunctional phosphopantothenoylcysteine decarboxylase/phosphopantothenate--cysteine ligase CoaBC [Ignavibacteriales bacterium]|nr:bifunctional phosphopantothenoylcysteine decarboxylase/phosphopantothenate--cysteine ligase CoaBC [Ignavibacteriales bacterium]
MLQNKHILIGVCGGIAAYKVCSVVRLLKKAGAEVRVLMTRAATQFVAPLTFSALSQEEVTVSLWPQDSHSSTAAGVRHIDLGLWADVMLVAPATADMIAKLAQGLADDVVSATALALRCPLALAPSMDVDMFEHAATQHNISTLRERGCRVLPPEAGELASGLSGRGRLPEPETIVAFVENIVAGLRNDFAGRKIVVTAGPTHEPIDPVRFIGNRSSGKMGFALAQCAAERGGEVTLVSGPVALATPSHVTRVNVETAAEMYAAVSHAAREAKIMILAAAVADFTPAAPADSKIKKDQNQNGGRTLSLLSTTDIAKELGKEKGSRIHVGFALETNDELENATKKLKEKNFDYIVLNSTRDEGAAFGTETNVVTIISANGAVESLPKMSKFDVATEILNRIAQLL